MHYRPSVIRVTLLVALATAALVAPASSVAAPRPGVFSGSLGVKVPKGGHATVRAIDGADGHGGRRP